MKTRPFPLSILLLVFLSCFSFSAFGQDLDWKWQNPLPAGNPLRDVQFLDAQTGWAVGKFGTILKTSNGGSSWTSQISGTTNWLFSVHFNDAQTGWAVGGDGTILKTSNGGSNWSSQTSGVVQALISVDFTDSQTGWAVGVGGIILKTSNGGSTWINQNSGTANWLNSVHFIDSQTGWAVGDNGTILHTTNGGGVPVAVKSVVAEADFSLYPNPAENLIQLKSESPVLECTVLDAMGKSEPMRLDPENNLHIEHLTPGLYWVRAKTMDGIVSKKFIRK